MADYQTTAIELKAAILIDYSGKDYINLKPLMIEFNVYEDLFKQFMRADVTIVDALGLIERLPIVGDETLVLQFKVPGDEKSVGLSRYVFQLVDISNRSLIKQRTHAYTLKFVSTETINNYNNVVRYSYSGMSISEIVGVVYDSYLAPEETQLRFSVYNSDKGIILDQSDGLHHFIAPQTSPFNFINYLATQAESTQFPSSSFVFYEDKHGFNFKIVEQLLTGNIVGDYYYHDYNIREQSQLPNANTVIYESQKIIDIDFVKQVNVENNYKIGMYNSVLHTVDPLTKRIERDLFDYDTQFGIFGHIDRFKLTTKDTPHRNNDSPVQLLVQSQIYNDGDYKNQVGFAGKTDLDPHSSFPFRKQNYIQKKRALTAGISNIVLNITIPGDSTITVGQVINVFIPQTSTDDEFINRYNVLYGGLKGNHRFLITALNHSYNVANDTYITRLQVVKDTYGSPLTREAAALGRKREVDFEI